VTISRSILRRMRSVSNKSCRENQSTHVVRSNFFFENRAVYEIMSKNTVESERLKMTIWRLVVCWIIQATRTSTRTRLCIHIHRRARTQIPRNILLYAIPLFSRQQWLRERASMLRYTYNACRISFSATCFDRYSSSGVL
jgi:hypothetical protein